MWRAFFLAIGIYMMMFGLQCLAVERVHLRLHDDPPAPVAPPPPTEPPKVGPQKVFTPAPWVPWSLMTSGAVVCLYSFTLPIKMKK